MHSSDLIRQVSQDTGLTQPQVKEVTNAIFQAITDQLALGNRVHVNKFGIFKPVHAKERKLSPAMGGGVCPAHNQVKFKPAKAVKEAVN